MCLNRGVRGTHLSSDLHLLHEVVVEAWAAPCRCCACSVCYRLESLRVACQPSWVMVCYIALF
jgi:hypothetical protein